MAIPGYTAIGNTDIDPDSPLTTGLLTLLRDNPLSQAGRGTGSPFIMGRAELIAEDAGDDSSKIFIHGTGNVVFDDTYAGYLFRFLPCTISTSAQLRVRIGNGSVISTSTYHGVHVANGVGSTHTGSSAMLSSAMDSNAGLPMEGEVLIFDPTNTGHEPTCHGILYNRQVISIFGGYHDTAAAIDRVQFSMTSGNINGTVQMWGLYQPAE